MAAPLATQLPSITPAEMQILVSRAGLVLNPGQVADLVLAWRQIAGLIAAMPRDRPLADDMALTFRLSPPEATEPPAVTEPRSVRHGAKPAVRATPRGAAAEVKPAAKAKRPAAAKRAAKPKAPAKRAPSRPSAPKR